MPDTNDLRLFEELRLHPWKDQDDLKIRAHLAMLSVTNPRLASEMTQRYADKLDAHLAKQPKPAMPVLTPQEKAEVKEEIKAAMKPKKAKKPSPLAHAKHV